MFKLQEMIEKVFNRFWEWSFQNNANKQFAKARKKNEST